MPMSNADIAGLFDEVANLLEIQDENPFRVRAYRNASRVISGWPTPLSLALRQDGQLPKISGVGKDLAAKIEEAIRSSRLAMLDDLKRRTPEGLLALLELPGIGPKRVASLQESLGIRSLRDLERALKRGDLAKVEGIGPKLEEQIRSALARRTARSEQEKSRVLLARAEQIVDPLLAYLRESPAVKQITVAGSFRRCRETVGDLDLLVSTRSGKAADEVMKRFVSYEDVEKVLAEGSTKSSVVLKSGFQVDLRAVEEAAYGAALHYFTGSKAHNIAIRSLGIKRGLKINEYGIFKGKRRVGGRTEQEVFRAVGLPYIEPELRENQGEIEAARARKLPELIRLEQIRGDLHAHSSATDGRLSIEEMAEAAMRLGYEYLAITDHSRRLTVARGLDPRRLAAQLREIDRINERLAARSGRGRKSFRILKSIEVDILKDGSIDLPDSILSQLDFTVCSIHSHFDLPLRKQVERILRAMDDPYFTILAHPSARLIGQRPPLELDMERIMKGAAERGCFLEINAQPERMDLTDAHIRLAKELGVRLAISTDAHSDHDLSYMKFGVAQARRGGLKAEDVLNTRSLKELLEMLETGRDARGAFAAAA